MTRREPRLPVGPTEPEDVVNANEYLFKNHPFGELDPILLPWAKEKGFCVIRLWMDFHVRLLSPGEHYRAGEHIKVDVPDDRGNTIISIRSVRHRIDQEWKANPRNLKEKLDHAFRLVSGS